MENQKVEIKDYEQEQHELLIALRMVGLNLDYITTDLIHRVIKVHKEKRGKMDIHDTTTIQHEHAIFWETYYRLKQEAKEESNKTNENE